MKAGRLTTDRQHPPGRRQRGFTLIEIMVVIVSPAGTGRRPLAPGGRAAMESRHVPVS